MMRYCVFLLLMVAACGAWPDVEGPALARGGRDWPVLQPLSELVEGGSVETAGDRDAARLAARAAALRARARLLRSDASDRDAMEALRARVGR